LLIARDGELPEEIISAPQATGQHLKPEFIFVRFRGGIARSFSR
jgi:hypothetical protein